MLAFFINAFAQSYRLPYTTKQPVKSPMEIVKSFSDKNTWKTPGNLSTEKINEFIKANQALAAQYALIDSVRYWDWNVDEADWENTMKNVDITYNSKNQMISNTSQNWDVDEDMWVNDMKSTYTYNNSDLLTKLQMEEWDGNGWVDVMRTIRVYDENKNQTSIKHEIWFEGSWITQGLSTYTYDANHNVLTETNQSAYGTPLTNSLKKIFTYDNKNNKLTETTQNWINNDWVDSYNIVKTYDNRNNLLTSTSQIQQMGDWLNLSLLKNTYDANDNITEILSRSWNVNDWENIYIVNYTYNAQGNELSEIYQDWENGEWLKRSKTAYTYNASNFIQTELNYSWDGDWINDLKTNYTYDASGTSIRAEEQTRLENAWYRSELSNITFYSYNYMKSFSSKSFDEDGVTVNSGDSAYYYYRPAPNGINELSDGRMTVYPNPTKGKLTLSSTDKINGYQIFNSVGEIILSESNTNFQEKTIDLSHYSRGIYVVRINTGNQAFTRKIILK